MKRMKKNDYVIYNDDSYNDTPTILYSKFVMPWCSMGFSNNWRKMHHYPMRRKYRKHYTYPCKELKKNGLCDFPYCLDWA